MHWENGEVIFKVCWPKKIFFVRILNIDGGVLSEDCKNITENKGMCVGIKLLLEQAKDFDVIFIHLNRRINKRLY